MRDNLQDRARDLLGQVHEGADDPLGNIFGRRNREGERRDNAAVREKTIEEIINIRQRKLANEAPKDDIINSMNSQLVSNERILEDFLIILLTNEKIECEMIPCLQNLLKIQNSNNVPVIRNKVVNAITFIIKCIANNDDASLREMIPKHDIKKKQSTLILIGTLRLLLKTNKGLMKYILKGLITRED